jgi:hypothetical protein
MELYFLILVYLPSIKDKIFLNAINKLSNIMAEYFSGFFQINYLIKICLYNNR